MDLSIASILVYLLAGLLLGLALPRLKGSKPVRKRIPGLAPSHPAMGNLGDIAKAGSVYDFLCRNFSRYGPIFSFWWADKEVVAVGHPEFFKSIQGLPNRPFTFKLMEPLVTRKSVFYSNKEDYQRKKKNYLEPSFLGRTMDLQGETIAAIIGEDYLPQWKQFAKTGEVVTANSYFLELSIKVVSRFALGEIFKDPQFIKDINEADNLYWSYMEEAGRGGLSADKAQQMIKEAITKLKAVCRMAIEHRKTEAHSDRKIFIDYLLEEEDTDLHTCEMIFIFIAGFHTSGTLLSWIMYDLCKHPQIQREIQKEIDEKSANEPDVLSLITAGSMEKLRNVIDESLRLHRLFGFHARYSEEETVFPDGYVVPPNTTIIISEGKVNLDNGIFKDAGEYIPDRFLSSEGREPLAFTPFGFAGKRTCPGKLLAYAEESIVVGTLLKHFNISFAENQTLPVLPDDQIICVPKSDIKIVIRPRDK